MCSRALLVRVSLQTQMKDFQFLLIKHIGCLLAFEAIEMVRMILVAMVSDATIMNRETACINTVSLGVPDCCALFSLGLLGYVIVCTVYNTILALVADGFSRAFELSSARLAQRPRNKTIVCPFMCLSLCLSFCLCVCLLVYLPLFFT